MATGRPRHDQARSNLPRHGAALWTHAFNGAPGSVYFGRSVTLNLALLGLPIAVWIAGSLLAGRLFANALAGSRPRSAGAVGQPLVSLYRFSVGGRPWPHRQRVKMHIIGLDERLPGFPEGADAVMSIHRHAAEVPAKAPDSFLATTRGPDDLEAMSAGLPIVAANAMALPHLVAHGANGYLYPPGDPSALSRCLGAVIADPLLRRSFGRTSQQMVLRHAHHATLDIFEEMYIQLVNGSNRRWTPQRSARRELEPATV